MIPRKPLSLLRASVLGLLAVSLFASAPKAQEATSTSPWTERLVATIPKDHSANALAWDSWISSSPDLSRIAYADRYRAGDYMRETIVFDGKPGSEFLYASRPAVSPDGRHVAYLAVPDAKGEQPAFLVLGSARVQIQIKDRLLGPDWIPVFSPDSRRLAFLAERPSGLYAIGVIDLTAAADQPAIVWGPEFIAIDRPRWSPDSSNVAYAARAAARSGSWS